MKKLFVMTILLLVFPLSVCETAEQDEMGVIGTLPFTVGNSESFIGTWLDSTSTM